MAGEVGGGQVEGRARLEQLGRVAVLSLSCGGSGAPVMETAMAAMDVPHVAALVLRGPPEAFAISATPALCDRLAAASLPVIAACAGALEDSAVELVLAAGYRLAMPTTKFAFPGVADGRLPQAGGVHRLVRLVGGDEAAACLLKCRPVTAAQAERIGLVDGVVRGPLEAAALSLARRLAGTAIGPRAVRAPGGYALVAPDPELVRRAPGAVATLQDCLAASVRSPAEAPRLEASRIAAYGGSAEAAALAHLASARAAMAPPPGPPAPVERIAVSGLGKTTGTLAPAFVHALARAGLGVELADPPGALDAARGALPHGAAGWIRATGAPAAIPDLALGFTSGGVVARFASGAKLLLSLAGPGPGVSMIEAEPSASDMIDELRAIGELCRRAGTVLVCLPPGGAPCTSMLRAALFEAGHWLLQAGWTPQGLDAAAIEAGLPMGPCAQEDAIGLNVGAAARAAVAARRDPRQPYVAVADRLHNTGRSGRRFGAGYFRYAHPFATPERDRAAEAVIAEARRDAGQRPRSDLTAAGAVRALLGAVEEAACACVSGGGAAAAVDLVAVEAGVFPAWLGGPVYARAAGGAVAPVSLQAPRP